MERNAQKTAFQSAKPDGRYSARFGLSTEPATPLPTAMLLCDSTIQNRLMGKYLADYGICRTYLASPSQLNALMQCERPALILLDIRSSDRAVADLREAGLVTETAEGIAITLAGRMATEIDASYRRRIAALSEALEPLAAIDGQIGIDDAFLADARIEAASPHVPDLSISCASTRS